MKYRYLIRLHLNRRYVDQTYFSFNRIFSHPNVMPVIGCCNSPPNLVVISQYIPIGSLFQVLHEQVGNSQSQAVVVDTIAALQFAHDIAKGMAFLHSLDRQMPRFHLNSKHVMVS